MRDCCGDNEYCGQFLSPIQSSWRQPHTGEVATAPIITITPKGIVHSRWGYKGAREGVDWSTHSTPYRSTPKATATILYFYPQR